MKMSLKLLLLTTSLSLVGCADMLEASRNLRESLSKTSVASNISNKSVISETPSQICSALRDNTLNAKRKYQDKRISFKAKALSISGDPVYGYGVISFKVKNTAISYLTKDVDKASTVTKGKTYTATGSIHELSHSVDTMDPKIKCELVILGDSLN